MLGETRDSITAVFRNRNMRRIQLALAGSEIGDWAYATAGDGTTRCLNPDLGSARWDQIWIK